MPIEYAKVEGGEVVAIGPEPDAFEIPDPKNEDEFLSVSTPADTPTDPRLLRKAGYLPVEDVYEETGDDQRHGTPELQVMATKVKRVFPAEDLPEPEPDPLAERVVDIDQRLAQVEIVTAHYKPMIEDWVQVGPVHDMDARALYSAYVALRARVAELEARLAE